MAQEENLSWLNSQESKEGADAENVPDIEDVISSRLQLLLFTSSVLYLQCLSPALLHSFFFHATSLFLAFSLYPTAIPSHHRSTPGLVYISHVLSTCLHQDPFQRSSAFTIRFFLAMNFYSKSGIFWSPVQLELRRQLSTDLFLNTAESYKNLPGRKRWYRWHSNGAQSIWRVFKILILILNQSKAQNSKLRLDIDRNFCSY